MPRLAHITAAQAHAALELYEPAVRLQARLLWPSAWRGRALDEDDLRAEGRVAVLEAVATHDHDRVPESAWVRTRIRQRMIDAIRRHDPMTRAEHREMVADQSEPPRSLVSLDSSAGWAQNLPCAAPWPDEAAYVRRRGERLRRALRALPARRRMALELVLFEGLTLWEIGGRMGISDARVHQLQWRAARELREALRE